MNMCLSIEFVPKARQAGFPNLVQPLNVHGAIYLRLVSQLVSILRAMAKQKSLTKSWRWHSGVVTSNPSTKHVPLLTETLAIFYQSIQN